MIILANSNIYITFFTENHIQITSSTIMIMITMPTRFGNEFSKEFPVRSNKSTSNRRTLP